MKKIIFLLCLSINAYAESKYETDFLQFWTEIDRNYAYFEEQDIDWAAVKAIYLPQAGRVQNRVEFIRLLETVLNELHNGHSSLNTNLSSSNRILPTGSDLFIEHKDGKYFIADVREGFPAATCGLRPGMQVVRFDQAVIEVGMKPFLPKFTRQHSPAMHSYALNMLFAGRHDTARIITVLEDGKETDYHPDQCKRPEVPTALLEARVLPGNVGYIKLNNSLGNYEVIAAFDAALDRLLETERLILDLSDTPSGGNTTVARAIMGRFIEREAPYQKHAYWDQPFGVKRSWMEIVSPRGERYDKPLLLQVGHWTGSMGEGLAIGFDALQRAEVVGTPMAGLLGAIASFRLKETGIGFQIPTERMYHLNGTPREAFVPGKRTETGYQTRQKALSLFTE